jgi:hypothetical protein
MNIMIMETEELNISLIELEYLSIYLFLLLLLEAYGIRGKLSFTSVS